MTWQSTSVNISLLQLTSSEMTRRQLGRTDDVSAAYVTQWTNSITWPRRQRRTSTTYHSVFPLTELLELHFFFGRHTAVLPITQYDARLTQCTTVLPGDVQLALWYSPLAPPRLLLETRLLLEQMKSDPRLVFETRLLLEEIRYVS